MAIGDINNQINEAIAGPAANRQAKYEQSVYDKELSDLKKQYANKLIAESEYNSKQEQLSKNHLEKMRKINQAAYKKMTLNEMSEYNKLYRDNLEDLQTQTDKLTKQQIERINSIISQKNSEISNLDKVITKAESGQIRTLQQKIAYNQKLLQHGKALNEIDSARKNDLNKASSEDERILINKYYEDKANEYIKSNHIPEEQAKMAKTQDKIVEVLNSINKTMESVYSSLNSSVNEGIVTTNRYMGTMNARLQGLEGVDFESHLDTIQSNIGASGFVSQKKLLDSVASLTNYGITYNVEQRALLMTLQDRLVTTFDALDNTLTRLVRIQQADLTMSQMGAEATLTQLLNGMFGDTSYLGTSGGSGIYDNVYAALLDASAQMDASEATSFNYAVQKWLGSLYSVGLSENAVSTISQGLGYLATGDVTSLNNNSALQTLLAMSAKNAGLSYSEMLTNGATADDVNDLMKSMVTYLQDISTNTGNQVTKNAFTQLLNISMADLQAVRNLSASDITSIYSSNVNYESSIAEAQNQISQVVQRTTLSAQIDTALENAMFDFGMNIANDSTAFVAWKVAGIIQDINKSIGETGTLNTVLSTLATALTVFGGLGSLTDTIGDVFQGVSFWDIINGKGFDKISGKEFLNTGGFDWSNVTSRGQLITTNSSLNNGISYSATVGDVGNSQQFSNSTSVEVDNSVTNSAIRTADDIYAELFESQSMPIRVKIAELEVSALEQIRVDDLHAIKQQVTSSVPVHETAGGTLFDDGETGDAILDTLSAVRQGNVTTR